MKVGVAGLGGIGSNVARHLVQSGIQELRLIDFDRVEAANLNRQFYTLSQVNEKKTAALAHNLKMIRADLRVEAIDCRIAPGKAMDLFGDCEAVVEGFDDKYMKKNLVEELLTLNRFVVSASGIGGRSIDNLKVRRIGTCHIVGDLVSDQDETRLFPPKIAIVAATMAAVIVKELEVGCG